MNVFDKSLTALDNYFLTVKDAELRQIAEQVEGMNFEGPTVEEYFASLFLNKPLRFKFQQGVVLWSDNPEPLPQCGFQLITQTPNQILESFFCNIASWQLHQQLILN